MANIHDVCDYIINRLIAADDSPSVLKVQKLLYYVQSWSFAIRKQPLFEGKFQAWVHGPVNREIYNRFAPTKFMYSPVTLQDSLGGQERLNDAERTAVDDVLDVYAQFSGIQLEEMTHREDPWLKARGKLLPSERCENEISEQDMQEYYAARL